MEATSAGPSPTAAEFRVLGPLEVCLRGEAIRISGHRRRVVLLMLLLEAGRIVTVDRLIHAIWDGSPPRTAETQVQICVSQLRSLLAGASEVDLIRTHSAGYLIEPPDGAVDMDQFRRLVASGRAAVTAGNRAAGGRQLRAALDLWRGDVATGVNSRVVQAAALRLNEERLAVRQLWLGLELELGRHQEHIGELTELVTTYPLREELHALQVLALYRAGRQAEALAACRHARQVLVKEHGIDPGEELRRLERAILDNDPGLSLPVREPGAVPRLLPAPPPVFVGRTETVAEIGGYLAPPTGSAFRRSVPVVSISGAPGVGKSALAVHIAYQVRDEFPDGQLYAHLRGSDAVPVPPEQVLNQFLRALGVAPTTLSGDLEELAARFRGRLADRRILIILDDAASAGQVRPLIPGDAHCALVVTSRSRLPGLAGAYRRSLEVLDPAASLALLSRVIGEPRVRAEPDATLALAEACGHLPLAMQVAAAKLSSKDHWRVAQMVSRLGDERRRLDELTLDDFGVRPSLSISYRALPPLSARLLMLLSSLGATEFGGWVAAPLLETEVAEAADVLEELVEARLVEVQTGAGYQARYRLHDLTRIFAGERLARDVAAAERAAAQHRLLRCWLFLVYQAHRREFGGDYLVLHSDIPPWPLPSNLVDALQSDPMLWLQSEYPSLVSAVGLAAQLRQDDLCWDLAVTSVMLFETRAYFQAWRETHEVAMEAVRRAGNRRGEAVLRYSRGGLALAEMRLVDAQHEFKRAFEWFAEVGDARGRGLTLRDLASIDRMQGRYDEAQARSEQALADLGSVRDRAAQAHVLRNLAQIHLECDRADEAELRLREALAICAEIGVRRVEAQVRYRLGQVLLAKGEPPAAAEAFRQVLSVAEHSNDVAGRANALLGIGTVHVALDELNRAETALGDALVAARNGGSRLAEGQILLALAEVFRRRGDRPAAAAELDSAAAIFLQIGAPAWRARADEAKRLLANGAIAGR